MPITPTGTTRQLRADDETLTWEGAVEVEHTPDWSRGWRLQHSRRDLFSEQLRLRALMQAGVRVVFGTDATSVRGRAVVSDLDGMAPVQDLPPVDLVVDGRDVDSSPVRPDGTFGFEVPAGEKTVELWLPQFGDFRLAALEIDDDARTWRAPRPERPKLITYGSSITQCRAAASPTRTWPALVARELGMDLTCLGYGGQCHLDPMVGRMIRDMPADVIVACLGINVHNQGTFNERSFLPAVLGMLSTIRDGHPGVPILVISPIVSPSRENEPSAAGMTLTQIRGNVEEGVRRLREHGDDNLHLMHGLDVLGPDHADLLFDGLHPDTTGYAHMAAAIAPAVRKLVG
ncbi:SGNH/GDSL hydrolase family protein [Phytoactinopolyspora halotolerans]|uniref:GDSL family lipase n=1 Tax=Phytoactinopolyspora halotolerans TaxID=1981512 RepID=A0A6L9SA25_9ACTN|nr:SGNH/GDSL hydrolase family protein [Phytoactinopolyspora halotolerans]NEE02225.1 GDSL family lipase [Phytoactinopolyspora halotolerans]